jgi:hypothetical protein
MKWTEVFQRKKFNGQRTHEEMLNFTGLKENANQNHVKIPHRSLEWLSWGIQTTNIVEDAHKKEPSYTVDGDIN